MKDPVVVHDGTQWLLWASVHPLDDPDATDRMVTRHATSDDGISWTWRGTALAGRPGSWDARGVRFAAVLGDGAHRVALYDGRRDAGQNWEEWTGLARTTGDGLTFIADGDEPLLRSPDGPGGLRYVSVVPLPEGTARCLVPIGRSVPNPVVHAPTVCWTPTTQVVEAIPHR